MIAKAPKPVVIVVQQESLKERPRIHKYVQVLAGLGVPFEIWKFGDLDDRLPGVVIRNLVPASVRQWPSVIRYLVWMASVIRAAWPLRNERNFYAVGFDSAFPLCLIRSQKRALLFDNIDNVSLSYRWSFGLRRIFGNLEQFVARRSGVHVVPSRTRWSGSEPNLRIVANTPSSEMVREARRIVKERNWKPPTPFTLYVNGWLSSTRGLRTLIDALGHLRNQQTEVSVLVAGRAASQEANELINRPEVQNLGMLSNAEALAAYCRCHLAFIYYDPAVAINRVAESQKWTDCWAMGTAFVTNAEIVTAQPFASAGACFVCDYGDSAGLARLVSHLDRHRNMLDEKVFKLSSMQFQYWNDEMADVTRQWLSLE